MAFRSSPIFFTLTAGSSVATDNNSNKFTRGGVNYRCVDRIAFAHRTATAKSPNVTRRRQQIEPKIVTYDEAEQHVEAYRTSCSLQKARPSVLTPGIKEDRQLRPVADAAGLLGVNYLQTQPDIPQSSERHQKPSSLTVYRSTQPGEERDNEKSLPPVRETTWTVSRGVLSRVRNARREEKWVSTRRCLKIKWKNAALRAGRSRSNKAMFLAGSCSSAGCQPEFTCREVSLTTCFLKVG